MRRQRGRQYNGPPQPLVWLSPDPDDNLKAAVAEARQHLTMLGLGIDWENAIWQLDPRMFQELAKINRKVGLSFKLPTNFGSPPLQNDWADVAKTMFVSREIERHKSISAHRTFLTALGFVAQAAGDRPVKSLTREILDNAGEAIAQSTGSKSQAYKLQNLLQEFVRRCVASGFCYASLGDYRYTNRERPEGHGGRKDLRVDDPQVMAVTSARVIGQRTYAVLGELYRNVPGDHKYRVFLLVITLLVCTGRRLAEISMLPRQRLRITESGAFIQYLKIKGARGSHQRTLARVPILTQVLPLVQQVLTEIEARSDEFYEVAEEMYRVQGPDLRFLDDVEDNEPLFFERLLDMGMPANMFTQRGCFYDVSRFRQERVKAGKRVAGYQKSGYVYKKDVQLYCRSHFHSQMTEPLYRADGRVFFLKDMLLLNYLGNSTGHYFKWLVTNVKEGAFRNFLNDQLHPLVEKFATKNLTERFTSHDFRHTLNDALDKGNLPEIMQSEFFGRSHSRDTKRYQHTTPEQRALKIREQIKLGRVGGKIADMVMRAPVDRRDALLITAVKAVHDVGLGLCYHAWHTGPCAKHIECDTGCDEFGYVLPDENDEAALQEKQEIKLQLAHNFLTLQVAVSGRVAERAIQWVEHTRRKIQTLLMQLADRGELYSPFEVDQDILSGGVDGFNAAELVILIQDGYAKYQDLRHTSVIREVRAQDKMAANPHSQYIELVSIGE